MGKNIFLKMHSESINYTSVSRGGDGGRLPNRNRQTHSEILKSKLSSAWEEVKRIDDERLAVSLPVKDGTYLEFVGEPDFQLNIKSLENRSTGIKLLNVRTEDLENGKVNKATVFVPKGKENFFLNKITEYQTEETDKGNPKNQKLIETISDINNAMLESFWIGEYDWLPVDNPVWCEIWIRDDLVDDNIAEISVRSSAQDINMEIKEQTIEFPERKVILVKANREQLNLLILINEHIAEIRRATEANTFFVELTNKEQVEWAEELLTRLDKKDNDVFISILDSGLNNGNILFQKVVEDTDIHSYFNDSGNDLLGHGTMMGGISVYGDLKEALTSSENIELTHSLESMKILPDNDKNDPQLFGAITTQSISKLIIEAPERKRIICMAVSSSEYTYLDGRPSSWSAAIDNTISGAIDEIQKIFIVAGGNIRGPEQVAQYPDINQSESIEDPGQSWNAITVGAYTNLDKPSDMDYELVARKGELSPYSRTSMLFDKKWPIKPEIVLEGGNAVRAGNSALSDENLQVLTTHHEPTNRTLTLFNATSAASAHASWMAAKIQTEYPDAWAETVRALLVHSADWTKEMKKQFLKDDTKTSYQNLLRTCGYGVPNLNRAIETVNNRVNLVIQSELQPFDKKESRYVTKDMHIHELPWPREELQRMFDKTVKLKVTLSYFIEPGPGEIGWKDKYRYASCGLRFDLNGNSDKESFLKRVNTAVREEGENNTFNSNIKWQLGPKNRNGGSIHSDTWIGNAADLASSNYIGIYPVVGWWRERPHLKKWSNKIRYSLVVSLSTPETEVDLLTPIQNKIKSRVTTEIETEY